jgi:hypothetical protein
VRLRALEIEDSIEEALTRRADLSSQSYRQSQIAEDAAIQLEAPPAGPQRSVEAVRAELEAADRRRAAAEAKRDEAQAALSVLEATDFTKGDELMERLRAEMVDAITERQLNPGRRAELQERIASLARGLEQREAELEGEHNRLMAEARQTLSAAISKANQLGDQAERVRLDLNDAIESARYREQLRARRADATAAVNQINGELEQLALDLEALEDGRRAIAYVEPTSEANFTWITEEDRRWQMIIYAMVLIFVGFLISLFFTLR